jgi:hypothetical protein
MGKTLVIWSAIAAFLVVSPTIGRAEVDRETGELIATMLNLNGLLCASVVDFRKLEIANQVEVTSIEYRGGSGTVRYILDLSTGKAFKA